MSPAKRQPRHYRTVWISDVHLGFRGCRAEFLLDFLHQVTCDRLYLVGDIIDFWNMRRGLYWPQAHNNVVRTLLGKAKHGTEVI
jgi:UDP-2,3-diacylglucosamine pyrophosphatase LpxH